MLGKTIATAVGGVGAAFTSALCCAGPLLAVTLGVSGAGLATRFDPLRSLWNDAHGKMDMQGAGAEDPAPRAMTAPAPNMAIANLAVTRMT